MSAKSVAVADTFDAPGPPGDIEVAGMPDNLLDAAV